MQNPLRQFSGLYVPEIETRTNARLKKYPQKTVMQVANTDIFSTGKFERIDKGNEHYKAYHGAQKDVADRPKTKKKKVDSELARYEAHRRAVIAVQDIALCNQFSYMFTWTLNGNKIDRYDPKKIYEKARIFLSHMVQRKGFQYLIVPEFHKRKKGEDHPAIHIHGLCNLGDVKIVFSGKKDKKGRPIYNMPGWKYGFSTCVPLDNDYSHAVHYVTKYLSKGDKKIFGKYYLSSRNLKKRPDIIPLAHQSFEDFRDEEKLWNGTQHETPIYRDICIVSETIESKKDGEHND